VGPDRSAPAGRAGASGRADAVAGGLHRRAAMLDDLPSGDPDETTVRIRLEPARGGRCLADTVAAPGSRRPAALVATAALAIAAAAVALLALA
jgi:hypothetical protein